MEIVTHLEWWVFKIVFAIWFVVERNIINNVKPNQIISNQHPRFETGWGELLTKPPITTMFLDK